MSPVNTYFDPATGKVRTQVPGVSIPLMKSFNGNIARGDQPSIKDLTGLSRGETVIVQHIPATGQIRLGGALVPPIIYQSGFEYPIVAGNILGQDAWVNNGGSLLLPATVVSDVTMEGVQSLSIPGDAALGLNIRRPLPVIPAGTPLKFSMDFTIPAGAAAPGENAAFGPNTFYFTFDQAAILNISIVGSFFFSTVTRGVKHRINMALDAAGNITSLFIDGLAIAFGAAAFALPTYINAFNVSTVANPSLLRVDNVRLTQPVPLTGGLLIPDGSSERFEAQTMPLDLTQIGVSVDPAAGLDATVEILVIGT